MLFRSLSAKSIKGLVCTVLNNKIIAMHADLVYLAQTDTDRWTQNDSTYGRVFSIPVFKTRKEK